MASPGKLKKFFRKILIIFIILAIIGVVVVMMIYLIPLIIALMAIIVPALVAAVSAIGSFVWGAVMGFMRVFKPIIQSLRIMYEATLKPLVAWLQAKVILLSQSIFKVYNLTVGGIAETYNNIFGWVDGVQTTFNRITDKTVSLIGIVNKDLAAKIDKLRNDVNTTIDKYTSDLFDKVLKKIAEVAGPILMKVQEVEAVFTRKTDHLIGLTDRFDNESDYFHDSDGFITESEDLDTQTSTYEAATPPPEEDEPIPPPYEPEEEKRTIWDAFMENHAMNIMARGGDVMAGVEIVIDEVVEQIRGKKLDYQHFMEASVEDLVIGRYWDDMILWVVGEITFGEFFRNHWKEVFFETPGEELYTEEEKEAALEEKRRKRDEAEKNYEYQLMP